MCSKQHQTTPNEAPNESHQNLGHPDCYGRFLVVVYRRAVNFIGFLSEPAAFVVSFGKLPPFRGPRFSRS